MLTIKLVPAEYGDCIFISIKGEKSFNILIDGGTRKTYRNFIKTEIQYIKNMGQELDLMICTHMDYDHISGLIEILKNENAEFVKEVWYNGFLQVVNPKYYSLPDNKFTDRDNKILDEIIFKGTNSEDEQEIGINDGMSMGVLIHQKSISLNRFIDGKAVISEFITKPVKIANDTYIKIIGPSRENLLRIEDLWKKEMVARNYAFRVSNNIKLTEAFEYQLEAIKMFYASERFQVSESDELEKYIGDFNVFDCSVTNSSSISFILEHNNKKYLFLGDAIIDDFLLRSIESVVGTNYRFAAIKLPHHGSRYNITLDFIERYNADEYYCLTNTKKFGHPDLEVLATIICKDCHHNKIIFDYPIEKAKFLDKTEWKVKYNYEVIIGNGNSIVERIFE